MAWFQVRKLLSLPPAAPHRFGGTNNVILLTIIMCPLLLSSSCHAQPCKCSSSDQDPRLKITTNTTFDQMPGYVFISRDSSNINSSEFFGTIGSYKNVNRTTSSPGFNLSDKVLFMMAMPIQLWEKSDDGTSLHEASFTASFTMSIYRSSNQQKVILAILPSFIFPLIVTPPTGSSYTSSVSRTIAESHVSISLVPIDHLLNNTFYLDFNSTWIEISIEPTAWNSTASRDYAVWIEYKRGNQDLSVYVFDAGKPKPDNNPIVTMSGAISNMTTPFTSYFCFFSSMGQLLQLHTWNSSVEVLPDMSVESRGKLSRVTILASVLASSVAMGALVATTVYCYFNSKYRTWKKDFDQLAKSMQQLPGVPIQVNFRDIQKATNNFHETMKLGRGGYGAVYRCRLPAPVKGEFLEVAVKKFTRDENRRYEDFLAEVSVINRLRHKNIVPLVGWSYNKGEPLLIYEYMPNGSLDQHLFRRGGDQQQRSPICQWGTRYNIVMDVATGLQYVHHEYEPMVLHRDIKASNIMIDSTFQGRLGDFGLACTVDIGKNSYTDPGDPRGTPGFIAHEYVLSGRATRKTDIFAFGVLILEIVTGKPPLGELGEYAQFNHITDWVWRLHQEGKILDAVDPVLTTEQIDDSDAKRLLLLGLACSSPNPSERPSMMEAMQVITKLAPPPDVPLEKPRFVWPPAEECSSTSSYFRTAGSSLGRSPTSVAEMAARGHASSENTGNSLHRRPQTGHSHGEVQSIYHTAELRER